MCPVNKDTSSSFPSERGDSNARPLRPERSALPTALLSEGNREAPSGTCNNLSFAGAKVQLSGQTAKENELFFILREVFSSKSCKIQKKHLPLHPQNERNTTFCPAEDLSASDGVIAQLVEQRTENPCVPGSIPGDTTSKKKP